MVLPPQEDKKMFDKLIESEPATADFKNRRRYFIVSTVVVGIFFATAVVISIYAADFSLGSGNFELEAMLAPSEMSAVAPEPPKPRNLASTQTASKSDVPIRTMNMSRPDEPTLVPIGISVERNTAMARPLGSVALGNENTNPVGSGRDANGAGPAGGSELISNTTPVVEKDPIDPPPAKAPVVKKPAAPQSLGVINGKAVYLPKPTYPATAIAVNAQGSVNVQVLIDETGRVVSASATGGHPLLRSAAEQAARNAKFSTTFLSNVPVKVTGVIVYNFSR